MKRLFQNLLMMLLFVIILLLIIFPPFLILGLMSNPIIGFGLAILWLIFIGAAIATFIDP